MVEITGKNAAAIQGMIPPPPAVEPPPPPKQKSEVLKQRPQVEPPPPRQDRASARSKSRLLVINGVPIKDMSKIGGFTGAERQVVLDGKKGLARYGAIGKNGVLEVTGRKI